MMQPNPDEALYLFKQPNNVIYMPRSRIFKGSKAGFNASRYATSFSEKSYKTKIRFASGGSKKNPNYRVTISKRKPYDF